jgi:hypothetical protein
MSANVFAVYDDNQKNDNEITEGLWFIRGAFKFLSEDEEFIYLRTIAVRLTGLGNGLMFYRLRFPVSIKISKPFYGFLPSSTIPLPGFGFCKKWEYIENDLYQINKESDHNNILSDNYHIELDGYFDGAYHFVFIRNPLNNIHSIMMSLIKFEDAEVNINYNELTDHGDGILFICVYNGLYDHDSSDDTLIMSGDAWYLKIFMR